MTGGEILFFIFVVIPASGGYIWLMWSLINLSWKIMDYFRTRKEYMQKVISSKENSNE